MKKILPFLLCFTIIGSLMLFIGELFFPIGEDGNALFPYWYTDISIIVAITLSTFIMSRKTAWWVVAFVVSSIAALIAESDKIDWKFFSFSILLLIIVIAIVASIVFLLRKKRLRKFSINLKKKPTTKQPEESPSFSITPGSDGLQQIQEACKALGTDLVELTNSGPCCEHCAKYRNRIYSVSGRDKRFPLFPKDYKPGCCLSASPFIENVMEPSFSATDIVGYSNRPFVDERTFLEKEQYLEWCNRTGKNNVSPIEDIKAVNQTSSQVVKTSDFEYDDLLDRAAMLIFESNQVSVSMLQRCLNLNYARAARIVDQLEEIGVVGPFEGSAPRKILLTKQQYLALLSKKSIPAISKKKPDIDIDEIIRNEQQWRRQQYNNELGYIDHMEGHQFERWCAELLQKNGFTDVEVTPGSNDQGVDVLAKKDGIKYAVQCKCYSSDLSNKPVQEINTGRAIYHCHVGAVMTNRYFTAGAKRAAEATGVLLWDRDKLIEMLK